MLTIFRWDVLLGLFLQKITPNLLIVKCISDILIFNFLADFFLPSSFHGEVINIFSVIYCKSTY